MIDRRRFLALSAAAAAAGLGSGCSSPPDSRPTSNTVRVNLDPAEAEIDLGGVSVRTWAFTGQVPAPEIRIRTGQTLLAPITNRLPQETTVHWHGVAVPNTMDGVPVLTQQAIAPGGSFTYEYVVPDSGTYYLHSHVGTQLDRGLYGALIVEDPNDGADYDDELVIVLDDWIDGTGSTPDQVLDRLRQSGMKPMEKVAGAGVGPTTPLGVDGGDVTYPYFLINGRTNTDPQVVDYPDGLRIRLRIINAGADTAFRIGVPNTDLTVTHTDGYPVTPLGTNAVLLGMGERADAIITVGASVPVVATPEGKDGHAQLNIRIAGRPSAVGAQGFATALRTSTPLNTATLAAAPEVALPPAAAGQVVDLHLTGPVNGYTWPINGRLYDPPTNGIDVPARERVRLRFVNQSMMFHPMHLHGHTFQVVRAGGPGARKDTVLVAPMQTVEVEFDTDNPGRWITHCHNDYHLNAGMATFLAYT